MNKFLLEKILHNIGLGDFAPELASDAMECRIIKPDGASESGSVGVSRIGGCPDLPSNIEWPYSGPEQKNNLITYDKSQYEPGPMRFIAQFNLQDIDIDRKIFPIPNQGILYFFSAVQKTDFPWTGCVWDDWKVIWWNGDGSLKKTVPREMSAAFIEVFRDAVGTEKECFFDPISTDITFKPYLQLNPDISDRPAEERSRMGPALMTEFWNDQHHLVGGRPVTIQSGIYGCGDYRPLPEWSSMNPSERKMAMMQDDSEWIQLAQFTSNPDLGLYWLYMARAHFMIRRSDLIARRFDQVVQVTQC